MSFKAFVLVCTLLSAVPGNWSRIITTYPPINESDTTYPLYFGLIVSFGEAINTSSNIAGVQLALDRINSDPYLLRNYTLHYVLSDSKVGALKLAK